MFVTYFLFDDGSANTVTLFLALCIISVCVCVGFLQIPHLDFVQRATILTSLTFVDLTCFLPSFGLLSLVCFQWVCCSLFTFLSFLNQLPFEFLGVFLSSFPVSNGQWMNKCCARFVLATRTRMRVNITFFSFFLLLIVLNR